MIRRLGLLLLIVSLTPAFAVDKTILELAREVGSLRTRSNNSSKPRTSNWRRFRSWFSNRSTPLTAPIRLWP